MPPPHEPCMGKLSRCIKYTALLPEIPRLSFQHQTSHNSSTLKMYLPLILATFLASAPIIFAMPQGSVPFGLAQCISTDECSWATNNGASHCICDYCPSSDFSNPCAPLLPLPYLLH
ncbi:hypothetical protein L207DRAFT_89983 [Hyaloscypha variabilis F]|uniref:Uncharacterized protein n=1 Tax=Hyaloscypha variabilis (strain UAMH 11265 / GT02V1 / F) TaxID=1149755 RepID=A0A2J6RE40_HYAVF|nr:hypothetical protein L207DRAFT_89983 [Hyaloscypha variabilis F]